MPYKVTVEIEGRSSAFVREDDTLNANEFSRILKLVANRLGTGEPFYDTINLGVFGPYQLPLFDYNGIRCGELLIKKLEYWGEKKDGDN